jgi:hypothetical protein
VLKWFEMSNAQHGEGNNETHLSPLHLSFHTRHFGLPSDHATEPNAHNRHLRHALRSWCVSELRFRQADTHRCSLRNRLSQFATLGPANVGFGVPDEGRHVFRNGRVRARPIVKFDKQLTAC